MYSAAIRWMEESFASYEPFRVRLMFSFSGMIKVGMMISRRGSEWFLMCRHSLLWNERHTHTMSVVIFQVKCDKNQWQESLDKEIFPVSGRKDTSHQTHLSGLRGNQPAPVHLENVFVHNKLKWIKVNNQQKSSNESKIPAHSANLRICSVGLAAGRQERDSGWQLADTRPSCRRVVLYTAIPRHMDNHRQSRQHCSSTHTVSRQWTQTNQSISQWYYSTITMAMHLNYKLYK